MRADLDTLRIHNLPDRRTAEVVNDLSRAQRRVEAIITALGQLASGQLAQAEDREVIDVTDLLDRVARENMRPGEPVEVVVEADENVGTIWGWPGGLRLAVDNLVRNAVTHGPATQDRAGRHAGWTTRSPSRSTTTAAGCPPRNTTTCSADSRAEVPPRQGVPGWVWRWWRSRPRCTAEASAVRQPARRVARHADGVGGRAGMGLTTIRA